MVGTPLLQNGKSTVGGDRRRDRESLCVFLGTLPDFCHEGGGLLSISKQHMLACQFAC